MCHFPSINSQGAERCHNEELGAGRLHAAGCINAERADVCGSSWSCQICFSVKTAFRYDHPFSLDEANQRYGQTLNMSAKNCNCLRNVFFLGGGDSKHSCEDEDQLVNEA